MKYIYSADWHIRFKNPRIRTDEYADTQYKKIAWICALANSSGASILVAGDIFDRPVCPIPWLHRYIQLFKSVEEGVYVIYGQHDIHFHNSALDRTPYGILLAAGAVKDASQIMDTVNFGEMIPDKPNTEHLCVHIPITRYEPPFFMEDAVSADQFMHENQGWKYIVSGDFHEQHVTKQDENNHVLFNPGPIMRADKSKMNFQPKVILHDTETELYEWIDIPIDQDVFDLDVADADSRTNYKDKMREFAGSLDVEGEKPNFMDNIREVIAKRKPNKATLKIIDSVMEEIV